MRAISAPAAPAPVPKIKLTAAVTPTQAQQPPLEVASVLLESLGLRAVCAKIIIATGIATRAITAPAAPAPLLKIFALLAIIAPVAPTPHL